MINYIWTISKLECYEQAYGQTDVVFVAFWTVTGDDGYYSASLSGTQSLIYDGSNPFTPYQYLTEQQVVDWVKNTMGAPYVASYENQVASEIQKQQNPVIVTPPLPWSV